MSDKIDNERPDFTKAEQAAAERTLDRIARENAQKSNPKPKP